MSALTKRTAAVYLAAVFLAGMAAGGLGGYFFGIRKAFSPPRQQEMSARMSQFAKEKLHLSDQQLKEIQPILDNTVAEFGTAFSGMADQINAISKQASERIAPHLNPEQKLLLAELDKQREKRFHEAFKQQQPPK